MGIVEWKEGLAAITGEVVSLFRAKLTAEEKKSLDIKLDDNEKVTYIKMSKAFALKDLAKKYGFTVKFEEKPSVGAAAGN